MEPASDVGDTYLEWALDLTPDEERLRRAMLERLPAQIIDCHAHSSPRDAIVRLSTFAWAQARSSFPTWTAEQSAGVREFLYGTSSVTRMVMGHPYRGFDHASANRYLLDATPEPRGVIICGMPDHPEYTTAGLASGRYRGLKMYPAYREPPYERISEYFPDWAMRAAATARVPIILHVARPLHLCADEVVALASANEDVTIILAHMGRMVTGGDETRAAFRRVGACPRVLVDTSMATDLQTHLDAHEVLGPERILFGSDEPFNLLRYVSFDHPSRGRRLMAPRRYHWLDQDMYRQYRSLAEHASLVHLQVLRAIVQSIDSVHGSESEIVLRQVFEGNAARAFAV